MSSVKLDKKKNSDLFEPQLLENNIKPIWKIFSKNMKKTPIFLVKFMFTNTIIGNWSPRSVIIPTTTYSTPASSSKK